MKKIKLTQGKYALVDDEDFVELSKYKWNAKDNIRTFYAHSKLGGQNYGKSIPMHRLITNAPTGMDVDHVDGNGLNNQRNNLRICTRSQNQRNRKTHRKGRLFGTTYYKNLIKNPWVAQITISSGARKYLGHYKTEESAHEAVLLALAIKLL